MNPPDWRALAAWRVHTPDFQSLRVNIAYPRAPVVDIRTVDDWGPDLRQRWLTLPTHPNLLSCIALTTDGVAIRYPALSWRRDSTGTQRVLVKWGRQLVDVLSLVANHMEREHLGLFLRPLVKIDVGGHARVGFLPLQKADDPFFALPKDIQKKWPRCSESALVFAAGRALRALWSGDDTTLETIIQHATAPEPRRRFATLVELRADLELCWEGDVIRQGDDLKAWEYFEAGAGFWDLDQPVKASACFRNALAHDPQLVVAREALDFIEWQTDAPVIDTHLPTPRRTRGTHQPAPEPPGQPWTTAEPKALERETHRDFAGALAIYRDVRSDAHTNRDLFTSRARCHLQVGETGDAIEYAQRALAIDGVHAPAFDVLVSAMLARHWHPEALRNAERLLALTPKSARAHYLLGKALFANGRIFDASDAFDHAANLDPKLLEAQLLLREVHRVTGNARKNVGSQHGPTFDVPEQLAELRDVLVSGDTAAAINALRDERYARDADAQLLLARFLSFDRRLDEAIAVYDQLEATWHRSAALVGKATALLELGRAGDALSIFEQLPHDADAAEGQARALEALGRLDEAAEAYRRFVALASSGSDLRVRAAELWLANRGR